jgi:hypothetical protein
LTSRVDFVKLKRRPHIMLLSLPAGRQAGSGEG